MFDISPVQTVQRGGGGDRRGGANVREVQRAGGREGGEGPVAGPIVELKDTRRMVEEEESLATLTRTMSSKFQPLGPTSKGKLPKAR